MNNHRKQKLRFFAAFIIIFITFTVITFGAFLNRFDFSSAKKPQQPFDAIVLLAGGITERAPVVVSIYNNSNFSPVLLTNDGVLSRWSKKHQRNLYNIEWTEELLTAAGIPASSIVKLPYTASGTVYDARAVRAYFRSHPMKNLLLVTSDYHTKRALWIFKRVMDGIPVSISVVSVASDRSSAVPIVLEPLKTTYYLARYGLLEKP